LVGAALLGACGSSAASASPAPVGSPAATIGSPSGNAAEEAETALTAFAAIADSDANAFNLVQEGAVRAGGDEAGFAYDLHVDGKDAKGSLDVAGETLSLVLLGEDAWVQQGGAWQATTRSAINGDDIVDIFRYVGEVHDLELVEASGSGDAREFHFTAAGPLPYETAQIREAGGEGALTSLDVYLRPDGTPVRMEFEFEATAASPGGAPMELSGDSTITFSNWGEPVDIEAPA
jgi:hypothetical protein